MRMPRLIALILTITFASAWPLNGQQAASYEPPEARVLRLDNGALLTGPSNAAARVIVARVLRERGVPESTLASLALVSESRNERTGIRDVRFEQRVAGLSVYDAYVRAALTADGAVVQIIDATVPVARGLAGDLRANAQQALRAALQRNHPDFAGAPVARGQNGNTTVFAGGPFFHADPTVTRIAIPLTDGSLRQGYLVETWSEERNQLNHTLVEGDGAVLAVESRTSQDSYNVFTIDPEKTPQTVVAGPGSTTESPEGWLSNGRQRALQISGNNVSSYLDTDANNEADAGGQTITSGNFVTAAELTETPSTETNKAVATQNLFYLNNVIHDRLYTHGFTEAAGNFQEKNFGRGGRDNDSVNAEAQDGSGTDNANFATPPDGKNPRMQMYLWAGRPSHFVEVTAPFSATFDASGAQFGPALDFDGITGEVALVNDGTAPTSNACEALAAGSLSGKIALIDRGTCTFLVKVKNAQNAGAIAAIVANNQGNTTIVMGGIDPTITIPSVFVGQDSGAALRSVPGVTANLRKADVISRDSSLDSDIVYHEYGHGLTWRMIGRMSGPLSGAIGEGMSDTLAIIINDNDRIGEYSFSLAAGIRSAPYTNYPRTYKNVAGTGVHLDGEVYAAIGWRLWQLFQAEFPTKEDARNQLLDYLVQGMTFTPAGPSYEDMRDGILTAVRLTNPGHECLIWRGFAKYGVGVGASGRVMGSRVLISESTQVPAGCPAP